MKKTVKDKLEPGQFVDQKGIKAGANEGVAMYTVGQRKGLGDLNEKTYVTDIVPEKIKLN